MNVRAHSADLKSPAQGDIGNFQAGSLCAGPSAITRYYLYSKERFPLGQFIPLSAVISVVAAFGAQAYLYGRPGNFATLALTFAAILLLLLRLRLVDELKDSEHDNRFYPQRPLPSGLVRPKEVKIAALIVFLLEIMVANAGGTRSLGYFVPVAIYSLLTHKEFFVPQWLRRHFTLYVISHELLVLPVCIYLYSFSGATLLVAVKPFFCLLTAFIFGHLFLLEITRKMRPQEMENPGGDTYTARYGIVTTCIVTGVLVAAIIILGPIAAKNAGSHLASLGYFGLVFLPPIALALKTFIVTPTSCSARAVFKWSTTIVLTTSGLFIAAMWFVQ